MKREEYTYNAASMRTRIDHSSDGFFQPYHKLYSYDALGQLVQEHKRWSGSNASAYRYAYTYDPAGNRTQMVHFNGSTTRTVVSAYNDGNQLTTHDGEAVTYDANGNLAEANPALTYTHNADNRLVAATNDLGMSPVYFYDALGRRLARCSANGQVWTRYYYDGLNIVMTRESSAATGGAGSWLTRRAYTLKQASIGQIVAEHTATAWNAATGRPSAWTHRFYHFDLLGNTTAETDANGMVANLIDMEAFGTVLQGGQAGFRLTTKEYDPEAGAYYFNARWYNNGNASFAEVAPYPPHLEHSYSFCGQNPVSIVDPTGNDIVFHDGPYGTTPLWIPDLPANSTLDRRLACVLGVFKDEYQNMKKANTIGADKFFHCMANCRAVKECDGENWAKIISDFREITDVLRKGPNPEDAAADQKANYRGRSCPANRSCAEQCKLPGSGPRGY